MKRKSGMTVKIYKNSKAYEKDVARMAKNGWRVIDVASEKQRAGCGRLLSLGIFALVFPPKSKVIVTYQMAT